MVAMNQVYLFAKRLWNSSKRVIGIGGDHALTWCLLRAARDFNNGEPVALVHLDSHLDTGEAGVCEGPGEEGLPQLGLGHIQ